MQPRWNVREAFRVGIERANDLKKHFYLPLAHVLVFCVSVQAAGIYFAPYPSSRYIILSSPLSPESAAECDSLGTEFAEVINELNAQHAQCLQEAPADPFSSGVDDGESCSKNACQQLHTARDEAVQKQREEMRICRTRLNSYLQHKEQEDRRERHSLRPDKPRQSEPRQNIRPSQDRTNEEELRRRREAEMKEEKQRQLIEAQRQYQEAVKNTARHIAKEWQNRIKDAVPGILNPATNLMAGLPHLATGSVTVAEAISAVDSLQEKARSTYAWINEPLQTMRDQLTTDAIRLVTAQKEFRSTDTRLEGVFKVIYEINNVLHDANPFKAQLDELIYKQLESHFQELLGEVENLEAQVGSLNYTAAKLSPEPLVNPFKVLPSPASTAKLNNPFANRESSPGLSDDAGPSKASDINPFLPNNDVPSPLLEPTYNPFTAPTTGKNVVSPGIITSPDKKNKDRCANKGNKRDIKIKCDNEKRRSKQMNSSAY